MRWELQVTIARQTGAVTVWLVILAAALLIVVTIVRCMHMLTGLLLGVTVSMGLLIAERTESRLVWPQVRSSLLNTEASNATYSQIQTDASLVAASGSSDASFSMRMAVDEGAKPCMLCSRYWGLRSVRFASC